MLKVLIQTGLWEQDYEDEADLKPIFALGGRRNLHSGHRNIV